MSEQIAAGDLARAREALERWSWEEAVELLTELDSSTSLDPADLEGLADAAWWRGQMDLAIDARQRAYAGQVAAGSPGAAARLALRIARDYELKGSAMADAWVKRAERLLAEAPESVEHGHLERTRSNVALRRGDLEAALTHALRTTEIGTRFGDANLIALGLQAQGNALVQQGRLDEG